jgi:hypothetical protein
MNHIVKDSEEIKREEVKLEKAKKLFSDAEIAYLETSSKQNGEIGNAFKRKFEETSNNIAKVIDETQDFMSMLPEAGKAEAILVPSILSPSDMYGTALAITVESKLVSDDTKAALAVLLNKYVNETLKLGTKLQTWIGDSLFRHGASPVVVVPKSIIRIMAKAGQDGEKNRKIDIQKEGEKLGDKITFGTEAMNMVDTFKRLEITLDITPRIAEVTFSVESVSVCETMFEKFDVDDKSTIHSMFTTRKSKLLETILADVDVSLNISKISLPEREIGTAMEALQNHVSGLLTKTEGMTTLSIGSENYAGEGDEPVLLRLPVTSVFPVSVPGSPESRIGYFICLDSATGTPLDASYTKVSESNAMEATFMKNFNAEVAGIKNIAAEQKSETSAAVFDMVIKSVLGNSIKKVGIANFDILNNTDLSAAIFNRVMHKHHVSFVFVPVTNMAYFAYGYRKDGTGKTLLEDASTLVALRTSVIIAKVVSLMENATDSKSIKYSMPDVGAQNMEQVNEVIKQAYIDKHMLTPSHNPWGIYRDLIRKSVSVVPKELDGIKDFSVEVDSTTGNLSMVNDDLEIMLTRMLSQYLRVPAAALDTVHEQEFSRSVATSNVLFSNDLKLFQGITCEEAAIIVKAMSKNSYSILSAIIDIVNADTTVKLDSTISVEKFVCQILDTICVSLPKPTMAPDKARMREISENIRVIEEIVDGIYRDDMLSSAADQELKLALLGLKALVKQIKIKELIANCGDANLSNIPELSFKHIEQLREFKQMILNTAQMHQRVTEALTPEEAEKTFKSQQRQW